MQKEQFELRDRAGAVIYTAAVWGDHILMTGNGARHLSVKHIQPNPCDKPTAKLLRLAATQGLSLHAVPAIQMQVVYEIDYDGNVGSELAFRFHCTRRTWDVLRAEINGNFWYRTDGGSAAEVISRWSHTVKVMRAPKCK